MDHLSTNAVALVAIVAVFVGWHTARLHRAVRDHAGAKADVKNKRRIRGQQLRGFLVIGSIVTIVAWWWMRRHGA